MICTRIVVVNLFTIFVMNAVDNAFYMNPLHSAMDFKTSALNKATFTSDSPPTYDQCQLIFVAWSGMMG